MGQGRTVLTGSGITPAYITGRHEMRVPMPVIQLDKVREQRWSQQQQQQQGSPLWREQAEERLPVVARARVRSLRGDGHFGALSRLLEDCTYTLWSCRCTTTLKMDARSPQMR